MNYYLVSGTCSFKVNARVLVTFIDKEGTLDRQRLSKTCFYKAYEGYFSPKLGNFLMLKRLSNVNIQCESLNLSEVVVKANYEAYFFKVQEKAIVDVLISNITPRGISGNVLGYPIEIQEKEVYAGLTGVYDNSNNSLTYPNNVTLVPGNVLRTRVQNLVLCKREDSNLENYILKGSCKYPGCGKL